MTNKNQQSDKGGNENLQQVPISISRSLSNLTGFLIKYLLINYNVYLIKEKKKATNVTGTFFSVTGTFILISKIVTARISCHGHVFAIFVTATQKNVTATFFGPKLSRAFFRCHGHFCENCHGHPKKCHGGKKRFIHIFLR